MSPRFAFLRNALRYGVCHAPYTTYSRHYDTYTTKRPAGWLKTQTFYAQPHTYLLVIERHFCVSTETLAVTEKTS